MINRYRYLACLLGSLLIALPTFQYIGQTENDTGGGPLAAGIAAGVGLGLILGAFLHRMGDRS